MFEDIKEHIEALLEYSQKLEIVMSNEVQINNEYDLMPYIDYLNTNNQSLAQMLEMVEDMEVDLGHIDVDNYNINQDEYTVSDDIMFLDDDDDEE